MYCTLYSTIDGGHCAERFAHASRVRDLVRFSGHNDSGERFVSRRPRGTSRAALFLCI